MRLVLPLLVVLLGACAPSTSTGASAGRPDAATNFADATLTPLALSTEAPRHMKSAGEVFGVVDTQTIWVRVDQGNVNLQVSLNGALIALRTDAQTTYAKVTVGLSGPSDLHKGDHVTFAFDPGSRDTNGSYLATVIGR